MTRCPFSLSRLVKVTNTGQVIYKAEKSSCRNFPEPAGDGLQNGPKRNYQILSWQGSSARPPPPVGDQAHGDREVVTCRSPGGSHELSQLAFSPPSGCSQVLGVMECCMSLGPRKTANQ